MKDKELFGDKIICDVCDYVWIDIYHIDELCRVECSNCKNMTHYTKLDTRIDATYGITR